jgi:hypothetical protein
MQQLITILQNYKTTLAGVAAIVTVVAHIAATGQINIGADYAAIAAGIGLILAHDGKSN